MKKRKLAALAFIIALASTAGCKKSGSSDGTTSTDNGFPPKMGAYGAYAESPTSIHVSGGIQSYTTIKECGLLYIPVGSTQEHTVPVSIGTSSSIEGSITGLTPNTVYTVGVYGINSGGKAEAVYSTNIQTPKQ